MEGAPSVTVVLRVVEQGVCARMVGLPSVIGVLFRFRRTRRITSEQRVFQDLSASESPNVIRLSSPCQSAIRARQSRRFPPKGAFFSSRLKNELSRKLYDARIAAVGD